MKITFASDRKMNLRQLRNELGKEFDVMQRPHTQTRADNGVDYFGYEIDIPTSSAKEESAIKAICDAHAPTMTDAEEEEYNRLAAQAEKLRPHIEAIMTQALDKPTFVAKMSSALSVSSTKIVAS